MPKSVSRGAREEFSRRVLMHMKRVGIKDNAELARRVTAVAGWQVDRQLVHKWVNAGGYPTQQNRVALAEVFGIPVAELTIEEKPGGMFSGQPAPLSNGRVPFRYSPDPHNPALVRAEMSDVLTVEQARKIAALLARP